MNFLIDEDDILRWNDGGCRPATQPEIDLWAALQQPAQGAYSVAVGNPSETSVPLYAAPQPAILPGYMLVPIEPTPEMIAAMCDGYASGFLMVGDKTASDGMKSGYVKMLAVAPRKGNGDA